MQVRAEWQQKIYWLLCLDKKRQRAVPLEINTSIHTDGLAARLAANVQNELRKKNPFEPVTIIMPNRNLREYLRLYLAQSHGIAANYLFYFLEESFGKLPVAGELTWPSALEQKLYALSFLKGRAEKVVEPELYYRAGEIQGLLRDYELHRPEIIEGWKSGKIFSTGSLAEEEALQKDVYFILDKNDLTLFRYRERLMQALQGVNSPESHIHIVAPSVFSRFHLDLIAKLSRHFSVHLYQLTFGNPAEGYRIHPDFEKWITPQKRSFQLLENLVQNNSLSVNYHHSETGSYENDALHSLRLAISGKGVPSFVKEDVVRWFSTSGPQRSFEYIYDDISQRLKEDETLRIDQSAVLSPAMAKSFSIAQSVFDSAEIPLPFNLSDAGAALRSRFADAVTDILSLSGSAWEYSRAFRLIENPVFYSGRDITSEEIPALHDLLASVNLRRDSNSPVGRFVSWKSALGRLRLGRLLASIDAADYKEIYPVSVGKDEEKYIAFASWFYEEFAPSVNRLQTTENPVSELKALVTEFLATGEDMPQERYVRESFLRSLTILENALAVLGLSFSLDDLRSWLREQSSTLYYRRGSYLSGGINLSSMLTMRPVPFRVLYLIDLNEGSFPPSQEHSPADLARVLPWKKEERVSDISREENARLLFLESVYSASDSLVLGFQDRDPADLSEMHMAAIPLEFLEILKTSFKLDIPQIQLPLHGISEKYFSGEFPPRLSNMDRNILSRETPSKKWKAMEESVEDVFKKDINLYQIASFLQAPWVYFLEKEMGIMDETSAAFEESEFFFPEKWTKSNYQRNLLATYMSEWKNGEGFIETARRETTQYIKQSMLTGAFPAGPYRQTPEAELQKEVDSINKIAEKLFPPNPQNYSHCESGLYYQHGDFRVKLDSRNYLVSKSGSLLVSDTTKFSIKNILQPFLFGLMYNQVVAEKIREIQYISLKDEKSHTVVLPEIHNGLQYLTILFEYLASSRRPAFFIKVLESKKNSCESLETYIENLQSSIEDYNAPIKVPRMFYHSPPAFAEEICQFYENLIQPLEQWINNAEQTE